MTKVIHVHLIFEKKDYYFGSISAIYTVLNDAQIGIKKELFTSCWSHWWWR